MTTVIYPCGCSASGGPAVPPLYCPTHGKIEEIPTVIDLRTMPSQTIGYHDTTPGTAPQPHVMLTTTPIQQ